MGVRPVMTCVSIGGPRGFIGFTILVGSVRGVAQYCGGNAVSGFVQWDLLVTMKLLPCYSPEIVRACLGNVFSLLPF
jgi:hypothetical protein